MGSAVLSLKTKSNHIHHYGVITVIMKPAAGFYSGFHHSAGYVKANMPFGATSRTILSLPMKKPGISQPSSIKTKA